MFPLRFATMEKIAIDLTWMNMYTPFITNNAVYSRCLWLKNETFFLFTEIVASLACIEILSFHWKKERAFWSLETENKSLEAEKCLHSIATMTTTTKALTTTTTTVCYLWLSESVLCVLEHIWFCYSVVLAVHWRYRFVCCWRCYVTFTRTHFYRFSPLFSFVNFLIEFFPLRHDKNFRSYFSSFVFLCAFYAQVRRHARTFFHFFVLFCFRGRSSIALQSNKCRFRRREEKFQRIDKKLKLTNFHSASQCECFDAQLMLWLPTFRSANQWHRKPFG